MLGGSGREEWDPHEGKERALGGEGPGQMLLPSQFAEGSDIRPSQVSVAASVHLSVRLSVWLKRLYHKITGFFAFSHILKAK